MLERERKRARANERARERREYTCILHTQRHMSVWENLCLHRPRDEGRHHGHAPPTLSRYAPPPLPTPPRMGSSAHQYWVRQHLCVCQCVCHTNTRTCIHTHIRTRTRRYIRTEIHTWQLAGRRDCIAVGNTLATHWQHISNTWPVGETE